MQVRVDYQDGQFTFDAPADRLVAAFAPPEGPSGDVRERIRAALAGPIDYPPLRQVVVPGDRVAIPLDPSTPGAGLVLACVAEVLNEVGVESIAAVLDGRDRGATAFELPPGIERVLHDPEDRESLAYLASTAAGRRIYLNRRVADADAVVPIGRVGPDEGLGLRGPWSVIAPGLTDAPAGRGSLLGDDGGGAERVEESLEVSWLLGSQLHVGVIPGESGPGEVLCGQPSAIRVRGEAIIGAAWQLTADDRVDLAIVGLGGPGRAASADDWLEGLRQALRVVRRGGKVAMLSRSDAGTIREAVRGDALGQGEWDRALAWADIYLLSTAATDEVEDLGMVPLDRPEQAAKLAGMAPSFVTIGQADRARAVVGDAAR